MRILAYNPGHDGAAVLLENGQLVYSIEGEKDDSPRHGWLSLDVFLRSWSFRDFPDVVVISGRYKAPGWQLLIDTADDRDLIGAGYFNEGEAGKIEGEMLLACRQVRTFSSSHVRSHIMCSYGLSPFPQGKPCYVLVWEGAIGAIYHVDERVRIRKVREVMPAPGGKYIAIYSLASSGSGWEGEPAGKVMALAAYGHRGAMTGEQSEIINAILELGHEETLRMLTSPSATAFAKSRFYKIGVESQDFKDLAWHLSEALFDRFYRSARESLEPGLPLLIGGGCGLNCDWNSKWLDCGLFSDVFVPPCTNDSGVAIGAAIDALHHYTGQAKIEWSVYGGESFVEDVPTPPDFECKELNLSDICRRLLKGDVIAWVQGRYEIGPRALGNRSLLAAPFSIEVRDRLNKIKQREPYRPVAPICLEEEFSAYFEGRGPSPHMLYFQRVKSPLLAAITHVDGSARAQSVNDAENPTMCSLLREFREQCGVGVLCNTSLNFKGRGFVNRLSQLFLLCRERGIDGMVVGSKFWELKATVR